MKRRHFITSVLAGTAGAAFLPAPFVHAQEQKSDFEILRDLSAYLNGITTMQGEFTQSAPDGRIAQGKFYLRRPGRLRFEYEYPYRTLVIADGFWAAVLEKRRGAHPDRIPLNQTPLYLLLKKQTDFTTEGAIRRIERAPGVLRILAIDTDNPRSGSITMIFSSDPIELRQWVVTDERGRSSTIKMQNTRRGMYIDPALFVIPDSYTGR